MKKILALILTFAMLCSVVTAFAGCDEKETDKNESSTKTGDTGNPETIDPTPGTQEPSAPTVPAPTEPTPTEPAPTEIPEELRGNQVGDYCYSRELLVYNENGLTGEKINPTTTGKPTIIHFYHYDYSTMYRLKMNYSDSFYVIMVNGSEYRDSLRQEIADRMPNAPFIFTCDTVGVDDANAYKKQLNADIVILDADGVITYTWNTRTDYNYPLYETLCAEIEKAGAVPDYPTYDFVNSSVGTVAVNDIYYRKTEHNGSYYKYCTCCHVSAITVDGKPLTRVNQYISYNYLQAAIDEGGTETVSITYQYWQKGDLLSMLFRKHTESSDTIRYHAINISLSQDRILPDNQFYAAAGFDQTEAETAVVSILKEYCDNFTWFEEGQTGWVKEETMADYNIRRSIPFLCGNSLCFLLWEAVPAASGWMQGACYADGSDYSYSVSDHKNCR